VIETLVKRLHYAIHAQALIAVPARPMRAAHRPRLQCSRRLQPTDIYAKGKREHGLFANTHNREKSIAGRMICTRPVAGELSLLFALAS